jgi:hypothetical protein
VVKRSSQVPRITNAARSRQADIRSREVRYIMMMGIRAICLVVATVLVSVHAPYLVIWIPILLFGVLVVPWVAVILANDRGPKDKYRLVHHQKQEPQLFLASPREPGDGPRTIDIDASDYRASGPEALGDRPADRPGE